jgi:NADP-dependent 3-hydroxy acid dehydrogenase YdfG
MHEVAIETYLKTIDVNMNGTYHYNSAVLREMVRQNQDGRQAPKGGYAIV